jgi:GNAT superfamily N-acetyltransferase
MASLDDMEILFKVRFDYFTAENWDVPPEQHKLIEDNLREYYSKYLNADFFAAFIEEDGQIASVAFLAILHKPANPDFPTGKTGTIFNVLTYPEYRKKGYATRTMSFLIDEAKKHGVSFLDLAASASGKPLYQNLGFVESKPSLKFTNMVLSLI